MPLTSAAKKVIIIFFVTAVALFISLPHEFSLFGKNFTRPNLDINAGRIQLHKSLDLVLGGIYSEVNFHSHFFSKQFPF